MGFKDRMKNFDENKFRTNELNEKTVQVLFERCLATDNTSKSDIFPCYLFRKKNGFEDNSDPVYLDANKLKKNDKNIMYILGQTKAFHNTSKIISIQDLLLTYKNTPWTTNTGILSELIILSCCSANLSELKKENDSISTIIIPDLKPTLSPDDPNFEKWYADHKSDWEDVKAGQEPGDE